MKTSLEAIKPVWDIVGLGAYLDSQPEGRDSGLTKEEHMGEPFDSFRSTYTLTELVTSKHIHDIFANAERMTKSEAAAEASNDDVVLVLGISEAQGDGLLLVCRGVELPRLIYYKREHATE